MILLSLDTCDARGSVALLRDDEVVSSLIHDNAEEYSSWLLPAIQKVLEPTDIRLHQVDVFVAATGPGSFTGVRIALTTVKVWNEVYDKPIVGVSRLEAIAVQAAEGTRFVASCFEAQREQIFGALYERSGNGLQLVGDEVVVLPYEFLQQVGEQTGKEAVAWASLDPARLTQEQTWMERSEEMTVVSPGLANVIGKIGFERAKAHKWTDALALDANYVRRSDAEIFWKGGNKVARKEKA